MRVLLSSANVPLTIHSKATELIWSKGSCKYRHTYIYIDMYKMTLTWMNEPRELIFHPLSTWPVLCNGEGPFCWQVGHISVAYFSFSRHQYLFLFLFYRIVVTWLSYSVSVWSLGQHVCCFSPAIALTCLASEASETYEIILFSWRYTRPFWLQTANHY